MGQMVSPSVQTISSTGTSQTPLAFHLNLLQCFLDLQNLFVDISVMRWNPSVWVCDLLVQCTSACGNLCKFRRKFLCEVWEPSSPSGHLFIFQSFFTAGTGVLSIWIQSSVACLVCCYRPGRKWQTFIHSTQESLSVTTGKSLRLFFSSSSAVHLKCAFKLQYVLQSVIESSRPSHEDLMAFQILFSLCWSDSTEKARQSRCLSCHLPGACQWCVCDQIVMRLWCKSPVWFTTILPAEYCSNLWRKVQTTAAGWAAPKNLRLHGVKARVQPAKVTKLLTQDA